MIVPTTEEALIVGAYACGFVPVVDDPGLFESCLMRPSVAVFGEDAYPTVWDKAAAVLHSLTTTQALLDGNKRTAWATCWYLLAINGVTVPDIDTDAAEALVLAIADNQVAWPKIAERLRAFAEN